MSESTSLPPADADPIAAFTVWLRDAEARLGDETSHAMCLATSTSDGWPSTRMVLLKHVDPRGFVFYTNLESTKGKQLATNPRASLCFFWQALQKQLRVDGPVEPVSAAEADEYFASRPFKSRIGAWASKQSSPLPSFTELLGRVARYSAQFALQEVTRPPFWSGFRVIPRRIEFWAGGDFRLHHRRVFLRGDVGEAWTSQMLYP